jgi:hypothetical protein
VIGLTSAANVDFVAGLDCYDQVLAYDDLEALPAADRTVFVDMAGNTDVRARLHQHLADTLAYSCSVGVTHWESADLGGSTEGLPGPSPTLFFAPTQIQKRSKEWGAAGMAERTAAAWAPFAAVAAGWIDVRRERGADAVQAIYQDVLHNRARPSDGFVLSL